MRGIALLLSALIAIGGCGGDDDTGAGATGGPLTVGQALGEDGEVTVRGALFVEGDTVRLCEAVMESYPPQCGGRALVVDGLDVGSLDLEEPNQPGFAQVSWSRRQVTLTGRVEGDVLHGAGVSG
jgi:hypothetical protein